MTRRFLGLVAGALVLPALASCATFDTDAATVNGTSISDDEIDAVRSTLTENNPAWLDAAGQLNGDFTRQALSVLIIREVLTQAVADAGVTVTADDLAAATDEVSASLEGLPSSIVEPIAYQQAAAQALSSIPPDDTTLEAIYTDRPSALGAVCVRLIGAPDETAGAAAADALRRGAPVSTAEGMSDDSGCAPVGTLEEAVGSDVAAELADADVGHVTAATPPNPTTGATNWQVMQVLPYAEAAPLLAQYFADAPGQVIATVALITADVSVDPQYGKWDAGTQSVVPV